MRRAILPLLATLLLPPLAVAQQPARPQAQAEARRAEANRLLDMLPAAPDDVAGQALEARIRALWAQGTSPAVALLLRRGQRNMESEAPADAVEDFDAALTLQPGHAEAWLLRAQALATIGDVEAAMRDLRQVLVLEPRHFIALAMLSTLQEQLGDMPGALRSMEEAMSLHPHLAGGAERLRGLHRKLSGDET
ncbi:tetratricopeptide repeat protein [Roseomonas sp. GC11]|uniref:tetratricopeptide repeat protein n=1 Tax=Roseomonas sp. GC11 TaxID=2950546 RepID=UPI00210B6AFF|nr:tetratricopeptide repeat protein [Roseomonas sp. GC11]MCQ4162232.1 tetratricopeptide repeat protein [Roseomonas sp. GC11]